MEPEVPKYLILDYERINHILMNLVSNALRVTENSVNINCCWKADLSTCELHSEEVNEVVYANQTNTYLAQYSTENIDMNYKY